jgi:hypothetical protein
MQGRANLSREAFLRTSQDAAECPMRIELLRLRAQCEGKPAMVRQEGYGCRPASVRCTMRRWRVITRQERRHDP